MPVFGTTKWLSFAARTTATNVRARRVQWTEPGGNVRQCEVLGTLFGQQDDDITDDGPDHGYRVDFVDDSTSVKEAMKLVGKGKNTNQNVLVYRGSYGNARQLLSALKRRARKRKRSVPASTTVTEQWKLRRRRVQEEAAHLNRLLVEVQPNHSLTTSKPPAGVSAVLKRAFGPRGNPYLVPLREILARIGSDQWRTKGVYVPQLNDCIYPHYEVYPPTRREYMELLPRRCKCETNGVVMDVGIGTGVLAATMLHRHPDMSAIGTDVNPLAIACAKENMKRLGFADRVQLHETSLFPDHDADVLVCNPPWIPGAANTWLDRAIYDDGCNMLYGFLKGAASHMRHSDSEAWLTLSDLAERLGLRSREELLQRIHDGGLEIVETRAAKGTFNASKKGNDEGLLPKVAAARKAEATHLYILQKRPT